MNGAHQKLFLLSNLSFQWQREKGMKRPSMELATAGLLWATCRALGKAAACCTHRDGAEQQGHGAIIGGNKANVYKQVI